MRTETEIIKTILTGYTSAVDSQNSAEAEKYMDTNFRVVLNNYKNLPEPTVLSKQQYLGMMQEGKVGGTKRSIVFELIDTHSSVAIAKLIMESEKNIFKTYYHLIKKAGSWCILSDTPEITSK